MSISFFAQNMLIYSSTVNVATLVTDPEKPDLIPVQGNVPFLYPVETSGK